MTLEWRCPSDEALHDVREWPKQALTRAVASGCNGKVLQFRLFNLSGASMKRSIKQALLCGLAAASFISMSGVAWADATLSSSISMDNGFIAYISTSDSTQGTQFSSGNDWTTTITGSTILNAGTDYYLHVYGFDQGGIAGFLGQFSLSGSDHTFANGSTTLLTNTANWLGNAVGFNGTYASLTDIGLNGISPWGLRPGIDAAAHWIWSGDANSNDNSYFTTRISAVIAAPVPEPRTYAMLLGGLGLLGFMARRRQKKPA
jgi:hypothetical protein